MMMSPPLTRMRTSSPSSVRTTVSSSVIGLGFVYTVYEVDSVLVFTSASAPGTELVLSGGQALLCDIGSYLMSTPFAGSMRPRFYNLVGHYQGLTSVVSAEVP